MTMILQRAVGGAAEVVGTVSNANQMLMMIDGADATVDFYGTNDPSKTVWYPVVTLTTAGAQTSEHDQKVFVAEHVRAVVVAGDPRVLVSGV